MRSRKTNLGCVIDSKKKCVLGREDGSVHTALPAQVSGLGFRFQKPGGIGHLLVIHRSGGRDGGGALEQLANYTIQTGKLLVQDKTLPLSIQRTVTEKDTGC